MRLLADEDNFDAGDPDDDKLSVMVGAMATPGDHTLTVTATMGGHTASATVDVDHCRARPIPMESTPRTPTAWPPT